MDQSTQKFILDIIDSGKNLTLATVRPDGYPQATTISYAHDGLEIYAGIAKDSQKAHNIRHCNKVSLTINTDYQDWNHVKGVSMGALAEILDSEEEIKLATDYMINRFPQAAEWVQSNQTDTVLLKITPQFISILDYEKGFGHTELVAV